MILGRRTLLGSLALFLGALGFGGLEEAMATTICVPSVAAACPTTAGAVSKADLEEAMSFQASDGQADAILLAAATYTEGTSPFEPAGGSGETLEPTGSDPLVILGAGAGSTVITSGATTNTFVINLDFNNTRPITLRDLTLRAPASMPDGLGAVIQTHGDTLEDVDVVSLNPETHGLVAQGSGNVVRGGEFRGEGLSGSIFRALQVSGTGSSLTVEDTTLRGTYWALEAGSGSPTLTARRVTEVGTKVYGAIATSGLLQIENSVLRLDDGIGLYASASAADALVTADHVTAVNEGGTPPALELKKFGSGAGDNAIWVSNSIFRGFASGYKIETAIGPGIGLASVKARYSNLPLTGTSVNGTVDFATGNIDADPLFASDLSLPAGSPSIDAGDPGAGLATDFLGSLRPVDGDGDGIAVRDQGAFEYQPPRPPSTEAEPDTTPPQTKITRGPGKALAKRRASFRFRSSEAGSRFRCKLDRKRVGRCTPPKRYKHLKPGRHVFRVWAIDAAGNKDPTPAKRRFRVPARAS